MLVLSHGKSRPNMQVSATFNATINARISPLRRGARPISDQEHGQLHRGSQQAFATPGTG